MSTQLKLHLHRGDLHSCQTQTNKVRGPPTFMSPKRSPNPPAHGYHPPYDFSPSPLP